MKLRTIIQGAVRAVAAIFLIASLAGAAHSVAHVEEGPLAVDCVACHWAKHSPADTAAPIVAPVATVPLEATACEPRQAPAYEILGPSEQRGPPHHS